MHKTGFFANPLANEHLACLEQDGPIRASFLTVNKKNMDSTCINRPKDLWNADDQCWQLEIVFGIRLIVVV
jgi:hypothetical protein